MIIPIRSLDLESQEGLKLDLVLHASQAVLTRHARISRRVETVYSKMINSRLIDGSLESQEGLKQLNHAYPSRRHPNN